MTDSAKPLKAYEVHDGDEQTVYVFATNSATARREGANQMDTDFESVSYCRRAAWADEYAPGPVSAIACIERGWWFECFHCSRRVSADMHEEIEDEGLNPDDFEIQPRGLSNVYCSKECAAIDRAEARAHVEACDALYELVTTKYPGCKVTSIYVYGTRLDVPEKGTSNSSARFTFPGGQYDAEYRFRDGTFVSRCDVDAFNAAYPKDLA